MFYNVLKAKDIICLDGEKFNKHLLMQNGESCLSIVALKKDEVIDTHTSNSDAAVFVLDGEIEIHFDAEKFTVDKGEILMFKKDRQHKVFALKDSKFLLIKI
jgi:quercetin dioxygenase-like cupin family protein